MPNPFKETSTKKWAKEQEINLQSLKDQVESEKKIVLLSEPVKILETDDISEDWRAWRVPYSASLALIRASLQISMTVPTSTTFYKSIKFDFGCKLPKYGVKSLQMGPAVSLSGRNTTDGNRTFWDFDRQDCWVDVDDNNFIYYRKVPDEARDIYSTHNKYFRAYLIGYKEK
jgi:hypothetical protein